MPPPPPGEINQAVGEENQVGKKGREEEEGKGRQGEKKGKGRGKGNGT